MYSKKHTDYSSFQDTVKFQNINIHNLKTKVPIQFHGHATMDPTNLKLKQDIVFNEIYCQPATNDDIDNSNNVSDIINSKSNIAPEKDKSNNLCITSHHTRNNNEEQIIDFGTLKDDFIRDSANEYQSDLSESVTNNSNNMSNASSLSINGSESSDSTTNNTTNVQFSDAIIQNIVTNDDIDDNEIMSVNSIHGNNPSSENSKVTSMLENEKLNLSSNPQQESIQIKNSNHFLHMLNLQSKELNHSICDKDYKECLELITILMKYKVPTNEIYSEIMKWRNKNQKLTSSSMTMHDILGKAKHSVYGQSIATKLTPIKTNLI